MFRNASDTALLEFRRNVFGVLLVALEDLQAGRQQILEFWLLADGMSVFCSAPLTVLW